MGYPDVQTLRIAIWRLVRRQHGVVAHWQLIELGVHPQAIKHRLATGRLHRVYRGVYAVGRPQLTRDGQWMAAVLACGPGAALGDDSAAAAMRVRADRAGPLVVTVPPGRRPRVKGVRVRRRQLGAGDLCAVRGIPVTSPIRTLLDLATELPTAELEAAVNEADKLELISVEELREGLDKRAGQPGVRTLRKLLDRHTFRLTESELERRFLRLVKSAGLQLPDTQVQIAGRVDFHWRELGLVVETDGWRYHRTPAQQARDNRRMQAHAVAGRKAVRISHYEIRYETKRVEAILERLAG